MQLTKRTIQLICDLERIIGNECYNPNSFDGWTLEEGKDFRYPVTYTDSEGEEHKTRYTVRDVDKKSVISLDDYHTALVGDFAAIRPLIEQLGTITERKQIYDLQGNNRGPGVILSVFQTMKLVNLMEEEGWDDLNPDVRRVAEARYNALIQITYK